MQIGRSVQIIRNLRKADSLNNRLKQGIKDSSTKEHDCSDDFAEAWTLRYLRKSLKNYLGGHGGLLELIPEFLQGHCLLIQPQLFCSIAQQIDKGENCVRVVSVSPFSDAGDGILVERVVHELSADVDL